MVFAPMVCEGYEWINAIDPANYEVFLTFDGSSRKDAWTPVRVRRVRADERQAFNASDFPWLGSHALILRKRAADALTGVIAQDAELLPLATDDGVELFVLNVTRILDALDREQSTLVFFRGTQRIMHIKKAVFRASAVAGANVFRLPGRAAPTYVSERFVDAVRRTGLTGLEFTSQCVES